MPQGQDYKYQSTVFVTPLKISCLYQLCIKMINTRLRNTCSMDNFSSYNMTNFATSYLLSWAPRLLRNKVFSNRKKILATQLGLSKHVPSKHLQTSIYTAHSGRELCVFCDGSNNHGFNIPHLSQKHRVSGIYPGFLAITFIKSLGNKIKKLNVFFF